MAKALTPDKEALRLREEKRIDTWRVMLHALAAALVGLSFFPMILFLVGIWKLMAAHALWLKVLAFSFCIGPAYFLFGTTLIFLCVLAKNLFRFRIQPGLFSIYSREAINWMAYNALILIANAAFLDVLRLSPFQTLFYRLMGAKIGKNVFINTGGLADLSMLEIGNNVTIGGGVALICHAVERTYLRLAPTRLENNVSIGIGSVIMPGCQIGEGAAIGPCSLVPKGSVIPPKSLWGGNPLRDLRAERRAALQEGE